MARLRHSAFDLADEAWCLLRQVPASVLAWYYLPTTLFVVGFIWYFVEMAANPYAFPLLGTYSLGLAVGYPVLRTFQTLFCSQLYREITGRPALAASPWNVLRLIWIHIVSSIAAILFVPISICLVIPWSWHYAYHQHLVTSTRDTMPTPMAWHTEAWSLALKQPKQHTVFFFFQTMARIFLFIIGLVLAAVLPGLLKSMLGVDTALSSSKWWLLNSTVWVVLIGAIYLFMDPLVKAFFVLRAFYAESIRSGDDLRGELDRCQQVRSSAAGSGVVLLVVASLCWLGTGAFAVCAEEKLLRGGVGAVEWKGDVDSAFDAEMGESLGVTSRRRHFSWRMELDPEWDANKGDSNDSAADKLSEYLEAFLKRISEPMKVLVDWIGRQFTNTGGGGAPIGTGPPSNFDWAAGLKTATKVALIVMGILLMVLLYRSRKNILPGTHEAPEDHYLEIPDMEDEALLANQLPEEDWLRIAEELHRKGELRTALRALFLAGLATLGRHEIIRITQGKSNREYLREVQRKAHRLPGVAEAIQQGVRVFEQSWYGWIEADESGFLTMRGHVEQIRGGLHD